MTLVETWMASNNSVFTHADMFTMAAFYYYTKQESRFIQDLLGGSYRVISDCASP